MKILSHLSRAKQVKPNQWMAGCPCCESRKGRPLSVTERDGKTLLHAFCGCSTEAVLNRLGLTVSDLFDTPLVHRSEPRKPSVPAGEVLTSLSTEATTLAVIASDMLEGKLMTQEVWDRLATATNRITNAADYINERAR